MTWLNTFSFKNEKESKNFKIEILNQLYKLDAFLIDIDILRQITQRIDDKISYKKEYFQTYVQKSDQFQFALVIKIDDQAEEKHYVNNEALKF